MPRVSHAAPVTEEADGYEEVKTKLLEKIRRARHKDYWRVVFQFEDKVAIDQPVVKGKETLIKLKGVTTNLATFRKFKKFPSWVGLKQVENDLEARIGLPGSFSGLNYFFLKKPDRLVVDLYHTGSKS